MICFQISIFEPLETTSASARSFSMLLWFAFKLVSLNHWKQLQSDQEQNEFVVICFQISIFEPLETTYGLSKIWRLMLWFAFKLVSLNHWKQLGAVFGVSHCVVICFQISIFEPLETTSMSVTATCGALWFAFKLVSLNHWKQRAHILVRELVVVICFQISIFEPLETTPNTFVPAKSKLWFAFKLVSLNHWKQLCNGSMRGLLCCDLLSN